MKNKTLCALSFLLFFAAGCADADNQQDDPASENDIDAARNFIQASLKGEYTRARTYMLNDSANQQFFDAYERNFTRLDGEEKRDYREASINIHDVNPVNDSTTIVIFSNSHKKDKDTLKVVKVNKEWLVDFKCLFQHSMDTMQSNISLNPDSLNDQ
jgi:hypothetical protein